MGYYTYYLAWVALAFAMRYPWLALGAGVFFLLRKVLPDPFVLLRTAGRVGALRQQIKANPANVTARRDLAMVLLEQRRPGAAIRLLDEALGRHPNDPELLYLSGLARLRAGDAENALEPLLRSISLEPRLRYGDAYLRAALVLMRLGRLDDAEDALEHYVAANSSAVEGHVRLATLRAELGEKGSARRALGEAFDTWQQIPGYQKRKQFVWWFRAQLARVSI